MDIICTLTKEEHDVLEAVLGVGAVQLWLQHALDNKIRQRVNASVLEYTDFNPSKLDKAGKMEKLAGVKLKQREDLI